MLLLEQYRVQIEAAPPFQVACLRFVETPQKNDSGVQFWDLCTSPSINNEQNKHTISPVTSQYFFAGSNEGGAAIETTVH